MRRKKVGYIISDIEKSLSFEWTANQLAKKYDLFFLLIGKNNTELSRYLHNLKINYFIISDSDYSFFFKKWLKIFSILRKEKPDVIHVHLWRAMFLGLTASWILRVKKRIVTRHYSTIHYDLHKSGLKWDKLFNWIATDIIAISENVRTILIKWDRAKESKVHVIRHGFDLSYFNGSHQSGVNLYTKYGINIESYPCIGVISRYLELKGIHYIIPAFKTLRNSYPNAHLILANTVGDYTQQIKELIKDLPKDSYTEIEFENDLVSLYKLFDVFVHTPVDENCEAFGQTYIEALAVGIPSIFTLSGVAPEFIKNEYNALVVRYRNSMDIANAIERILHDELLKKTIIKNGRYSIQKFSLNTMINKLESLYD